MSSSMHLALSEKAAEVAVLLNSIVDDDERELLQEHYERELNDLLYMGSELRAAERSLPA